MQPSYEPISRLVRRQDDLCVSVVPTGSEATIFSKGAVDPIRDHRYAIVSTHSAVIAAASLLRSLWIFRPVKVVCLDLVSCPLHNTKATDSSFNYDKNEVSLSPDVQDFF